MEDAHCAVEETFQVSRATQNSTEPSKEIINLKIFGVFDGHGGAKTARLVAELLPHHIIDQFKKLYEPGKINNVPAILRDAFLSCDLDIYQRHQNAGSTAAVLVVLNNMMLYVCNTGDSRCVLSTGGAAKNLSFDHKPNNIGELVRIQDAGGGVSMGRVNGLLALLRAFGDFSFKKKRIYVKDGKIFQGGGRGLQEVWIPSEETQVTVEPEIISLAIDYLTDEFVVLACDGIWDLFKNSTLTRLIRQKIATGVRLDKVSELIIDKVLKNTDSSSGIGFDNMTVLIVALHKSLHGETLGEWYAKIKTEYETEMGLC